MAEPPKTVKVDSKGLPDLRRTSRGGHLEDVPLPHVRLSSYPGVKREVTVTVSVFSGIGVHHHVIIDESDDYIWDSSERAWGPDTEEGIWRSCWDDVDGKGQHISEKFNTRQEAEDFVQKMKTKHFPPKTHVLINSTGYRRWHYRDGD